MKMISQKKCLWLVFLFVCISSVSGIELFTIEEGIKKMLPDAEKVVIENREISKTQLAALKKRLGGSVVHYHEDGRKHELKEVPFYIGYKGGKRTGVAIVLEQPGKWGPVKYMIVVDPATASIKNLTILSYTEKRGRPIARRNFLKQFIDKTSKDSIKINQDINGISGATISSDATCFAVKLTLALFEEVYSIN